MSEAPAPGESLISHEQIYAELGDVSRALAQYRHETTERLDRGEEHFRAVDTKMTTVLNRLEDVKSDTTTTKEIVEAWAAVKTAGRFIKWFGGIVGGITAIIVAAKLGFAHMIGSIR